MRYPDFLPKGGTIGFAAPSCGCATEPYKAAFDNAQPKLKEMGYQLVLGPNCYEMSGVGISNTPEKCGQEFMEMYLSGKVDSIISCGGGELMCEILPYVDFDRLAAAKPIWFMGYSDNTNLTYLLATLADTASVYGPCAGAFGMEPWHESLMDALLVLTGERRFLHGYGLWEKESLKNAENPLASYHVTEPLRLRSFIGKKEVSFEEGASEVGQLQFTGRLLGGCMDCLVNLPGTRFDKTREFAERYREDGIIWFLESCELNVFSIRRAMWQMEQAGWFQYAKGFLIGRPENGEPMMGLDRYEAVLETAGRLNVPVIMDVDLGHLPPMMPLVTGSIADVTVEGNDIAIAMDFR